MLNFTKKNYEEFNSLKENWMKNHRKGFENFQNYISLVNKITEKKSEKQIENILSLEKIHSKLFSNLKIMNKDLLEMKNLIENSKRLKGLNESKGDFNCQLNDFDYISFMEKFYENLEQEQETKEILFYSLNENENVFILNTYLITWKSLPFIDSNEEIYEQINLNERMNNKLKMNH
eukprot:gene90-4339_t